ncbi:MAG: ATP-binding cassette domain-containing protein [Nostocaceae cyanobacterium]|nr:ATP-binding cassette domain-containing protein [Nostocaceae cyanobacterium]
MSTQKLLLKFAKPYPGLIFLTILLGFSGALFNGVGTALIVPVILRIVGQEVDFKGAPPIIQAIMSPFENIPENNRLMVMTGAIICTIFFKNCANYASTLASSSLSRMLTSDMREAGLKLLLEIDIAYYTKMKVGDLINRLGGEISRAASAIGNAIKLIIVVITILVLVGLLLSISWQLTVASTILLFLVTLINQYAISRSKDFGKQLSEMSKAYSITVLETLSGIRLVKSTGNEEREYQRIQKLIREREKAEFKSQVHSEAIAPVSEVTGIVALISIVFLGRTFFADQIASLSAVLLTYLLVLFRLLPFISQLNTLRSSFANTSTSVDLVTDFLRRDNKPFMSNGKQPYIKLQEGIHFQNISFAYPGQEHMVLKKVDLHLPRGTTLALVGGSGAGKSTLADLLPRFYDPISGCISLDNQDLRSFDLKSLRSAMGIVSQDTFLFNDTVENNIGYGRPGATFAEVEAAAKRANAYEFIIKLPQGFETIIGDRGVMLSGGQRQRLAIARALLQDPEILILDEATSALDTVSERLVQTALDDLSRDRTTLVIAHRLSTVQKADQIAVLDQGHVVEVGTHEELLHKGGYYSRLYQMQFTERHEDFTTSHQTFLRTAHEVRTRLNSMIGLLQMLLDDMVESPEERHELITESYNCAGKILNSIEFFEDSVKLHLRLQPTSFSEPEIGLNNSQEDFIRISHEIRTRLNPMLGFLGLLVDNMVENVAEEHELLGEAYHSVIHLIDTIEFFEDSVDVRLLSH